MFRAPSPNSSTPSTPESRRSSRDIPSTTPAGPPPDRSFISSSTPAGPPPTGLFGGSQFNVSKPARFNFGKPNLNSSPPKHELTGIGSGTFKTSTSGRPGSHTRGRSYNQGSYGVPSSPPEGESEEEDSEGHSEGEDDEMDEDEDDEDEDAEGEEDEEMDDDEEEASNDSEDDNFAQKSARGNNKLAQSVVSRQSITQELASPPVVLPTAKQTKHDLLGMAKAKTSRIDQISLREPDEIILETERLLEKLHESTVSGTPQKRIEVLGEVAQDLVAVWQTSSQQSATGGFSASTRSGGNSPLGQAHRLASLVFNIHHPKPIARQRSASFSLVPTRSDHQQFTPIPKVLLDWLNGYHHGISEVTLVMRQTRGYSAHEHFWDAVQASALRGNFADTLKLLKGANFAVAETAVEDGLGDNGYRGDHLDNTNRAVQAAINLIQQSPAIQSEDWDIKGHDWSIFRQRVHQAFKQLQEFAEGDSQSRQSFSQSFQASHFGMSQSNNFNLSVASRKAESKVPWSIYENLTRLYKQLLGAEDEIMAISADWVEAVIALSVWWNGDEEDFAQGSLAASRRSLARSQRVRTVDVTPVKAYCQRLTAALATVLESTEEDFSINPNDRADIGLACAFDDNLEGVLQILGSFSLTIASAVAEIATGGDWFKADGILGQLGTSDLMVFDSINERPKGITKDAILVAYAEQLAVKEKIQTQDGKSAREGWELAIQVLGRLDDHFVASSKIDSILNDLRLDSSERVDKITQLCYGMGLSKQAQSIALSYAESLRANTQNFGDTLLYYARAHDAAKIQEVLRVLVSHCLVKSIAYPPLAELDEQLHALITSPKQTLTRLATQDPEGAHLLSTHLSGYATIRKFYDLRDEAILANDGEKPLHRPMVRKRAAANALMVIISSAASSIRGGLYDPSMEAVVHVDVLLPLLGEALLFVNQSKRMLTLKHLYSLLAAVEDIDTAPSMIRAQCEEVLSTTLAAAHEGRNPSPRSTMQKSTSNLTTASSQYSLIGSTEFGSVEDQSTENSAVLVRGGKVDDTKRAWDWRKAFNKDATGNDVVRILRLGIAKETARAFAQGET